MNEQTIPQNAFTRTLGELRKGGTVNELSNALQALTKAVRETGKKGVLTLKLTLSPANNNEVVLVSDDVQVKEPKMSKASTTFFMTEDDLLSRSDPRQAEMFQAVDGGNDSEEEPQKQAASQ